MYAQGGLQASIYRGTKMKILASTAIVLALGAGAAQAVTYDVTSASSVSAGQDVALWFDELISTGDFINFVVDQPGTYFTYADGTSVLNATAYSLDEPTSGFDMSFAFSSDVPVGSVYKNVFDNFGLNAPSNTQLSVITSGSLTGFGEFNSLIMGLSQFPSPENAVTQTGGGTVGDGTANQHNENFGLSSWFAIDSVEYDAADCLLCDNLSRSLIGSQGDVVFDLIPAVVPIPAGILFSLTGLAALGFARRRS